MKHLMAHFVVLVSVAIAIQAQVTGSGTAGKVPVWTGSTKLGNSVITQVSGGIKVSSSATPMTATTTSSSASAVVGNVTNATGTGSGVQGSTVSTKGNGVSGAASATSGWVSGVNGQTNSSQGWGVLGTNLSATGNGGAGVQGFSNATTGLVWGVQGSVDSNPVNTTAVGVQASGYNAFRAFSQTCPSVPCTPLAGTAGFFSTGSGGTILQGYNASTSATVFFLDSSGNLTISGKLTKGSGSFKIDHPLDPANKYLSHSFVESPDMMDIYNGNVITDDHGSATIVLPNYFEALNRDFRYQLTAIGQFAQVIVAKEILDNHFTIQSDKPKVKVSWQVTGVRHDPYADANRIQVEEDKGPQERGHYLHPEFFGGSQNEATGRVDYPNISPFQSSAVPSKER